MIVDTNRRVTTKLTCLKSNNVTTVIRYYARTTSQPEKRLRRDEAAAAVAKDIAIAVVFQSGGAGGSSFSSAKGLADARYALEYAISVIGQPEGSAIYFAVDYDCSNPDVTNRIIPHFKSIHTVNESQEFSKHFRIGAYGNGLVLRRLLADDLIEFAWLSQSTGHAEHQQFIDSGKWSLRQQPTTTLCGIKVDNNLLHPALEDFGQFAELDATGAAPLAHSPYIVAASSGLRLREGPGTDFAVTKLLPAGTQLRVLTWQAPWAIVDVTGDGFADGAVHGAFLQAT